VPVLVSTPVPVPVPVPAPVPVPVEEWVSVEIQGLGEPLQSKKRRREGKQSKRNAAQIDGTTTIPVRSGEARLFLLDIIPAARTSMCRRLMMSQSRITLPGNRGTGGWPWLMALGVERIDEQQKEGEG
jgi:hypothetical protein